MGTEHIGPESGINTSHFLYLGRIMKFRTEVELPSYSFRLDHLTPSLFMGSCFTENVGRRLERWLFPVCINPFGTIYNPLSVLRGLEALTGKEVYTAGDLDRHEGLWFSFDHYTAFSSPDREACLEGINRAFNEARKVLAEASVLVLTWGTAWVYRLSESEGVVCNCHKLPASRFRRSRLGPEEITGSYESFLSRLFDDRPDLKVLLTVSPVRHWKDGARGNQLSKASLLLATEALVRRFPEHVFYFPSYEIVMDELRDYRFYAADMLHMDPVTTDYLLEKFSQVLLSEGSLQIIRDLEPLLKLLEHRPRETGGPFREKLREKKETLQASLQGQYPFLPWEQLEALSL
jgi:hypothetical protein